jgi:glucose uptake protein GlcU
MSQPAFSIISASLITIVLPLSILLVAAALSVKYFSKRKRIGTVLAIIGVLEMLGYFMLYFTFEGVSYRIPFSPREIMLIQGIITLYGGIVILLYAKPKSSKPCGAI